MASGVLERLPYVGVAIVVYALFHLAARIVRRLVTRLTRRQRKHRNVGFVLGRLAEGGLMLVGVLVGLVIALPSFQPAQLIQLLGISGVAFGFAFRDILQNFLSGILILLTEPFRLGDQIIVGGFEGTVEEIETRATLIRTYDGRRVVIPNSTLFTDSVTVNTAFDSRRMQYDIGIGYGDDIAHAKQVITRVLRQTPGVLDDPPPEALVVDLADSTVTVRARWWIAPPRRADVMASQDAALHALKDALTEAGIDLPFPTRQILFHDQTEQTDGRRDAQREGWPAGDRPVPHARAVAAAPVGERQGARAEN
jgi:small-conductance mechanosensitive channel